MRGEAHPADSTQVKHHRWRKAVRVGFLAGYLAAGFLCLVSLFVYVRLARFGLARGGSVHGWIDQAVVQVDYMAPKPQGNASPSWASVPLQPKVTKAGPLIMTRWGRSTRISFDLVWPLAAVGAFTALAWCCYRVITRYQCRGCEYDLAGLPRSATVCPECGLARP